MSSLNSVYGPSVTIGSPWPSQTTNFAASGDASPSAPTSSPSRVSSSLSTCWNSMWAAMSSGDHSVIGTVVSSPRPNVWMSMKRMAMDIPSSSPLAVVFEHHRAGLGDLVRRQGPLTAREDAVVEQPLAAAGRLGAQHNAQAVDRVSLKQLSDHAAARQHDDVPARLVAKIRHDLGRRVRCHRRVRQASLGDARGEHHLLHRGEPA